MVVYRRPCDLVTKKGTLLMNMISISRVTCCNSFNTEGGTGSTCVSTRRLERRVVLPFRLPRLGPRICSAAHMSAQVREQPARRGRIVSVKWRVAGRMRIF